MKLISYRHEGREAYGVVRMAGLSICPTAGSLT